MRHNLYFTFKIVIGILAIVFAGINYNKKVLKPLTPYILECEGLVMDSNINYHISNKANITNLKNIRDGFVEINESDIILNYTDQDMDKLIPAYCGSFQYKKEWTFKLDKSFTNNPDNPSNIHLPFLRKTNDPNYFYPAQSIIKEAELNSENRVFFNNICGDKNSRYYLEINNINKSKVLKFDDDGMKRSYKLQNEDSTLVLFNPTGEENKSYHYRSTYLFDNSSNVKDKTFVIYNNQSEIKVKDLTTGQISTFNDTYFQIGDMMFSISPRFSIFDKITILCYLLILSLSLCFFLFHLPSRTSNSKLITDVFIAILILYILGTPNLINTIDLHIFKTHTRKFINTIFIPLIPITCYLIIQFINTRPGLLSFINKLNTILTKIIHHKIGISLIMLIGLGILTTAQDERVLRSIPTMHFVKLLLFFLFYILYSPVFKGEKAKNLSNKIPKSYRIYIRSVVIICFSILTSIITQDFGSLILISLTVIYFEKIHDHLPIKFKKIQFNIVHFIGIFFIISLLIMISGTFFELPKKLYRLTFTYMNPDSDVYKFYVAQDRESIGILYQNLKIFLENPFGISNLSIPHQCKSVSHTDFAIHWSIMDNGISFLSLILISTANLTYVIFRLVYVLIKKQCQASIILATKTSRMFIGFILIFILAQCYIPIFSNLLLPGAVLTGIPFIGVSISLGDGLMLFVLFLYLSSFTLPHSISNHIQTTRMYQSADRFAHKMTLKIIIFISCLMGIKYYLVTQQKEFTRFRVKYEEVNEIQDLPKERKSLIQFSKDYFLKSKNELTSLDREQKHILSQICCQYYTGGVKKLAPRKSLVNVSKKHLEVRICQDEHIKGNKVLISGNEWDGERVYAKSHIVNGRKLYSVSSPYFENTNFQNQTLNRDISAMVNKRIEEFIKQNLNSKKENLAVSVLVTNTNGDIIVNSTYPNKSNPSKQTVSFYPGSIKKIILAHHFSMNHKKHDVNRSMFKNTTKSPKQWIKTSDHKATIDYWKTVNLEQFKKFLKQEYPMFKYTSNSIANGYNTTGKKANSNVIIGGGIKYTAEQINNWMRTCQISTFEDHNEILYELLNSPLTKGGTASRVSSYLRKHKYDPDDFICKTGTLEYKSKNIATSFSIANSNYSITVLIDGIQPENNEKKSAKDLFINLINLMPN